MASITLTTTLTNGHSNGHVNGKLENGLNGYRKNGYVKKEQPSTSAVSITLKFNFKDNYVYFVLYNICNVYVSSLNKHSRDLGRGESAYLPTIGVF